MEKPWVKAAEKLFKEMVAAHKVIDCKHFHELVEIELVNGDSDPLVDALNPGHDIELKDIQNFLHDSWNADRTVSHNYVYIGFDGRDEWKPKDEYCPHCDAGKEEHHPKCLADVINREWVRAEDMLTGLVIDGETITPEYFKGLVEEMIDVDTGRQVEIPMPEIRWFLDCAWHERREQFFGVNKYEQTDVLKFVPKMTKVEQDPSGPMRSMAAVDLAYQAGKQLGEGSSVSIDKEKKNSAKIYYLRNGKNERVVCIYVMKEKSSYWGGIAVWNRDNPYSRKLACGIARRRAERAIARAERRPDVEYPFDWRSFSLPVGTLSEICVVIMNRSQVTGMMIPAKLVRAAKRYLRVNRCPEYKNYIKESNGKSI